MAGGGLPHVGDAFGRFRIVRQLGRGGMGAVYAADQMGLGREVALKVLLPEYADDAEFRGRFTHEATVLAGIDHPHVVHVYDHGEQDAHLYLATQLVAGGDLSAHLRTYGPLEPDVALAIAAQMADALSAAHERGVVHRDVKPGNVLLRRPPEAGSGRVWAYLGDFGIASTGESIHTATGAVVGTWRYLSPERCRGEVATASGDIYSVGCLMWTMLTGAPPYEGTDVEVGMAHLQAPIPQLGPDAVAAEPMRGRINSVLRSTMAKEPADRIATAAALRDVLTGIRTGQTPPPSAVAAPQRQDPDEFHWKTVTGVRSSGSKTPTDPSPPPAAEAEAKAEGPDRPHRRSWWSWRVLMALVVMTGLVAGAAIWLTRDGSPLAPDRQGTARAERNWEPVQCSADASETLNACPTTVRDDVQLPVGDFDGDGFADAAVLGSNPGGQAVIQTLLTDAKTSALRTWATLDTLPEKMLAGDVNGDGKSDLILLTAAAGGLDVDYLQSTRYGLAAPQTVGRLPARFAQQGKFAVGDLDNDQHADLVAVGVPGTGIDVQVMRGTDRGMGDPEIWTELSTWTWKNMKIAVSDVNGDDRDDLISMGRPPGGGTDLRIFPSTGTAFSRNQGWASIPDWSWDDARPIAGDYDGDGDGDVALVHGTDAGPELGVYLSDGGAFAPRVIWTSGTPIPYLRAAVGAGDLDGDGRDDLAVLSESEQGVTEELHHSTGSGFSATLVAAPVDWLWSGTP